MYFDDVMFENDRVSCYGEGGDAPCYFRRCKKCCRFVKMPEVLRVPVEGPAPPCPVECAKCGPSEAPFAAWSGDFQ